METDKDKAMKLTAEITDTGVSSGAFTAFCYGMSLALAARGQHLTDYKAMLPILKRMEQIAKGKRGSLIKAHDDIIHATMAMRELEKALCMQYLAQFNKVNNGAKIEEEEQDEEE